MKDKITKLKTYPEAARVVALYLDEFCDRDLDYVNMIAEASREASKEIERLRSILMETEKWKIKMPDLDIYPLGVIGRVSF